MNILYIWIFIFKPAFQRIVNKTINRGIIKLQHLFQMDRSYGSNPMILTLIKHQLFLTTFIRHSYDVTSIILLLFLKEISNNGYAAHRMNFFIIELILKVSIVISNTLESLIILLRRLPYVKSNFSSWPTVKFQFWHEYANLLRTKLFRNMILVLR